MRIVSINVGLPRAVRWRGRTVMTAIYKQPIAGAVRVAPHNLAGDRQADPRVHGGRDKAVYAYAAEHYDHWRVELPDVEMGWGMFGENLTVAGLDETRVHVGDRFQAGTAELVATEPRLPCFKLGIRFGSQKMVRRFAASGRCGVYFAVARAGVVAAGDRLEPMTQDPAAVTIRELFEIDLAAEIEPARLERALASAGLPERWRERLRLRLDELAAGGERRPPG